MQSRKISVAAASTSVNASNTGPEVTLNLAVFGNSKVSDGKDIIAFHTLHSIRNNLDYITVDFAEDDGYAKYHRATIKQADFEEGILSGHTMK